MNIDRRDVPLVLGTGTVAAVSLGAAVYLAPPNAAEILDAVKGMAMWFAAPICYAVGIAALWATLTMLGVFDKQEKR